MLVMDLSGFVKHPPNSSQALPTKMHKQQTPSLQGRSGEGFCFLCHLPLHTPGSDKSDTGWTKVPGLHLFGVEEEADWSQLEAGGMETKTNYPCLSRACPCSSQQPSHNGKSLFGSG